MPKTKADKNIDFLKTLRGFAPEANKTQINTIINLYKDKQIPNIKTAVNAINLLSSSKKSQQTKAKKSFNDIIKKAVDESSKEANKELDKYESLITKHNILPDDTVITGDHSKVNSYIQFNINKEHPKDKPMDRHSFDEVYATREAAMVSQLKELLVKNRSIKIRARVNFNVEHKVITRNKKGEEKIKTVENPITFSTKTPERLTSRNVEEVVERQMNILRENLMN